jgi:ribose transport system ATP-binding protein
VTLRGVDKSYGAVAALRGIGLDLYPGEAHGLVGENGAGKSTLMNILGGVVQPDAGSIRLAGEDYAPADPLEAARRGVAFIHQELNLFANLTVAENLFLTRFPRRRAVGLPLIDRRQLRARTASLLAEVELQVPPDTSVGRLSQGERQLVEIARALGADARLIIFDEPTTSLTAREAGRLFAMMGRLRARGIAMIYISHLLGDVLRLSDDIAVLRDGELVDSGRAGDFTSDRLVSRMVGRQLERLYPERMTAPGTRTVLEVRGLSQPGVFSGLQFSLREGEMLGVFGLMGSGRTEMARAIFGLDPCAEGEVLVEGSSFRPAPGASIVRRVAFLTEDRRHEGLLMEATVMENVSLASLPRYARRPLRLIDRRLLEPAVAGAVEEAGIRAVALDRQEARTLSGGNQQKTVLAKWLLAGPRVFILDEPTRGIDVGAKHEIYGLMNDLAARGAGLLFISSEIEELIGMCDRILVLRRGEIAAEFPRREFDREAILRTALGQG